MGAKLPAFQFYPSDWRNDLGVQSLSRHDRMVWFELLLLMHESERRGVLVLNGIAMSDEMIAELIHVDNQTFNQVKTLLLSRGIASLEPQTGAIMNRRMVRDEDLRKTRANAGKMGGNPALLNQTPNHKPNHALKQKPTPSSSSSFASSASAVGEARASAPPPDPIPIADPMADVPEGLAAHNYADAIMEAMCWPRRSGYAIHVALVDVLPMLAREEGCTLGESCRRLYARIRDADKASPGKIKWRFWLGEERGWKQEPQHELSIEGLE